MKDFLQNGRTSSNGGNGNPNVEVSGGGCNSGYGLLALLVLASAVKFLKKQ